MNGFSKDIHPLANFLGAPSNYKVYIVDESDELHERVLTAKIRTAKIEPQYYEPEDVFLTRDMVLVPPGHITGVKIEIDVEQAPEGHFFTITDFTKEEEDA